MYGFDLSEIKYCVSEHRCQRRAEMEASIAQQKRIIMLLGQILTRIGAQMLAWGQALQATPTQFRWQDTAS